MNRRVAMAFAVSMIALSGCENIGTAAQSKTTQGAVVGSLLGAGTGAIIGNQSDHAGAGTAIGAGLGALAGGLVGHAMEEKNQAAQQQQFPPAATSAPAAVGTKFCPVGGETYDASVKYCPTHGVELKVRQ